MAEAYLLLFNSSASALVPALAPCRQVAAARITNGRSQRDRLDESTGTGACGRGDTFSMAGDRGGLLKEARLPTVVVWQGRRRPGSEMRPPGWRRDVVVWRRPRFEMWRRRASRQVMERRGNI